MGSLSVIKILGHLVFAGKSLKLPTKKASGGATGWSEKYWKDRDQEKGEMTGVPQHLPFPFFQQQKSGYKYHTKTTDKIGKDFQEFHDKMIDAVQNAHSMWKLKAKFKDIKVMALAAIGTPGCLDGPELESDIKKMAGPMKGNMGKYRDAVAKGVSKCFKKYQDKVMIPGLPLYPAFVMFPGPMAPPMPGLPVPLIACPSAMCTEIFAPSGMKKAMIDALDGGMKQKDPEKHHEALFDAIATALSIGFLIWTASQMVNLLLGKGPIPTFAPPVMPAGPVVGGQTLGTPGHVM
jgi:hypothetical protein